MNEFGIAFGESILKDKRVLHSSEDLIGRSRFYRFYFFITILLVGVGLLFLRLFSLTIIQGGSYKKLSSENRIREVNLPAPRGVIYDRNKIPLVRNIPVFSTIDGEVFFNKPESNSELIIEGSTREYIYHEIFGNLLGYISEADPYDLKKLVPKNSPSDVFPLKLRDSVGKMGIEESFDSFLRGRDGSEMFEVDATGKYVRTLGKIDSVSGNNLTLNVDLELQKIAAELLKNKKGAVVVSNPKTGEILVLYSSPSFDPNKILKAEDLDSIFANPDKPLFNRSISGVYPPGSTFKIVTAIAGLESETITKNTTIEDTGIIKVGERFSYTNWYFTQYGKTEGQVDLKKALQRSNDIYFYKIGEKTGIETLAKWAKLFGVGRILGIDIKGEEKGLMPDPIWRKKVKNEDWFLGNTYISAIGQGDILTTPLQVNFWTNVIANGGYLCRPNISKSNKISCQKLPIKKENIEFVKDGLVKACQTGGTGWPLFNFQVDNDQLNTDNVNFFEAPVSTASSEKRVTVTTACKTGTAEFGHPKNHT